LYSITRLVFFILGIIKVFSDIYMNSDKTYIVAINLFCQGVD